MATDGAVVSEAGGAGPEIGVFMSLWICVCVRAWFEMRTSSISRVRPIGIAAELADVTAARCYPTA